MHCRECGTDQLKVSTITETVAEMPKPRFEFRPLAAEDRERDLVTLVTCRKLWEADMVVSQLEAAGLTSFIPDQRVRIGFTLIELLIVIAIIAILAALLLPALARAKQKGQQAVCLSNLKQVGLAFEMYLNDHDGRFADRRDLKSSLPGGYRPWTSWPPSDPRGGWAAIVLKDGGASDALWSCPASVTAPAGNAVQSLQIGSTNGAAPIVRYWLWRFDRPDDPVGLEDFWGKTEAQSISDLQAANDPTVGPISGAADVELAVDPYFPKMIPTVPPELKGRTIHVGGRCRVFLDGHVQFIRDSRTPL